MNGFADALCTGDLLQHLRIAVHHPWEVHYFAEVAEIRSFQQVPDRIAIDRIASDLEGGGGHAAGCDLVRVADGGHGALGHCQPGEFAGQQHVAFHMHVRINKTRYQVAFSRTGHLFSGL